MYLKEMSSVRFAVRPLDGELLPPTVEELKDNMVHVWWENLPARDGDLTLWLNTLAADERDRANRYYFERDRAHFVAGRGKLRSLLGYYLNLNPQDIQLVYSETGKPQLQPASNPNHFVFNVSHSQDLIVYAIGQSCQLGVDLEFIRPLPKAQQLAKRFFTPTEAAALQAFPPAQQQLAFFRGWTRKEAFLKATGVGITQLQAVSVSLQKTAALAQVPAGERLEDWVLRDLPLKSGYVGAIAASSVISNQ